jgi:hypothetical protein
MRRKCLGMLMEDIIMLCDNSWPWVICIGQDIQCSLCWKVLDHLPSSLDPSTCDIDMFKFLKKGVKSHRFGLEEDIKAMVVPWFQQ